MLYTHSTWQSGSGGKSCFEHWAKVITSKHLHMALAAKAIISVLFDFFIHKKLLWPSFNALL